MSNENYLKKLFIDEAKPALQRHSGGGGGGSSDIIDCDSLPTSNIEADKIYRVRWTETIDTSEYIPYMYAPGGDPDNLVTAGVVTQIVDTIDDVEYKEETMILCKQDGKIYMCLDGVVVDALEGMPPEEAIQMGLVDESFAVDPSETRMLTYTVKIPGEIIQVERQKIGVSESDTTELLRYDGYNWTALDGMRCLLKQSTRLFESNNDITSLKGVISYSDTSDITDMGFIFKGCEALTEVPLFDTSNVTNMNNMFSYCYALTEVPLFDTSNVTSMNSMFSYCEALTEVPLFDTSNVTNMRIMFWNCKALTKVPLFDTSNVTDMDSIFKGCEALTEVPLFDTSNVTGMSSMFYNCKALTEVPLFDTSNVTNMNSMFYNCEALTEVPLFDTSNVTGMSSMFNNCKALTECWLRNIKTNLQVGSGTSYGHLLTVDSLVHLIYELRDTGSSKTLTVDSANLEKLANVYVKTVEITDEMRAEDDLVDEKLPFVVCESTDEGATLITDYVGFKNWVIK